MVEIDKFLHKSIDEITRDKRTGTVDFPQEADNITRKPSLVDRSGPVCIGKIPIRMPGKCCQCTPVETQVRQIIFVHYTQEYGF